MGHGGSHTSGACSRSSSSFSGRAALRFMFCGPVACPPTAYYIYGRKLFVNNSGGGANGLTPRNGCRHTPGILPRPRGLPLKNIVILLLPLFILVLVACSAPEPSLPGTVEAEVRRPAAAVSTSTPLPAAETMPIPYRLEEYTDVAYTIDIPTGWVASVVDKEGKIAYGEYGKGTFTIFAEPGKDPRSIIGVVALRSAIGVWEYNTESLSLSYADTLLKEVEEMAVEGTYYPGVRRITSGGLVTNSALFQPPGGCPRLVMQGVLVLSNWFFIVDGIVCEDQAEVYGEMLVDSFNSFAPTALGQK